jgi:hypothetical protein
MIITIIVVIIVVLWFLTKCPWMEVFLSMLSKVLHSFFPSLKYFWTPRALPRPDAGNRVSRCDGVLSAVEDVVLFSKVLNKVILPAECLAQILGICTMQVMCSQKSRIKTKCVAKLADRIAIRI